MLHPQTIAAAVLAIVAALNGSDALDAQPARRVRPPRGQQYDFWFGTSKLTELKFQKKFRLSRDAFPVDLTESIRGDLGKNAAACALRSSQNRGTHRLGDVAKVCLILVSSVP